MSTVTGTTRPNGTPKLSQRLRSAPISVVLWLALLGIWWLVAATNQHSGTLWPLPNHVASTLWTLRSAFLSNAGVTLHEAGIGFIVAVFAAVVLALLGNRIRALSGVLQSLALAIYSLPLIAIAPVLVLWLGSGLTTKVIIAALSAFFPILINLTQALRTTQPQALELMQSGGATSWQTFRHVELPYALPMLFASFAVAGPAAIVGAMLAEWVGANSGLGIQLLNSMSEYDVPELYGCLVVAAILSLLSYLVFELLGRRLFPWHASLQRVGVDR
jgi:ABC-type nitrate/sulfonate/bicarbonate transport system permease component